MIPPRRGQGHVEAAATAGASRAFFEKPPAFVRRMPEGGEKRDQRGATRSGPGEVSGGRIDGPAPRRPGRRPRGLRPVRGAHRVRLVVPSPHEPADPTGLRRGRRRHPGNAAALLEPLAGVYRRARLEEECAGGEPQLRVAGVDLEDVPSLSAAVPRASFEAARRDDPTAVPHWPRWSREAVGQAGLLARLRDVLGAIARARGVGASGRWGPAAIALGARLPRSFAFLPCKRSLTRPLRRRHRRRHRRPCSRSVPWTPSS
jgi:hypothetical protein